jgi:tetratricopeptide (TPR) repeat protein
MYHFRLGEILDQLQMPDLAIKQYQEGLLISPNNAHALLLLGLDLEIHKRQYKEALDCYARAHQVAPSDQNIKAHLTRLDKRLAGRSTDIAWQLRDWLASLCQHSESEER